MTGSDPRKPGEESRKPTPGPSRARVYKAFVREGRLSEKEDDFLAVEEPLEITLSYSRKGRRVKKLLGVTMRTPGCDIDLLLGFLFAEGIIHKAGDVSSIDFDPTPPVPTKVVVSLASTPLENNFRERNFAAFASCGVCGISSLSALSLPASLRLEDAVRVDAAWIHHLPDLMRSEQPTFRSTGGLHAAALFSSEGELLAVREDIGRHNALDKAVGAGLTSGWLPGPGHILCVSGRTSYEILQKALVARIPVVAGIGAPSSLAVTLANDYNVTLLGFVRDKTYSVYSAPERLAD